MKNKITLPILLLIIVSLFFFGAQYSQKKKEKISYLQNKIIDLEIEKNNVPEQLGNLPFYFFNKKEINFLDQKFFLTSYKTDFLNFTKGLGGSGSSYIDIFDDNLYLVTANGIITTTSINSFNNKKFEMNIVKNNLKEILNQRLMFKDFAYGIKDILISSNKIYLSFTDEIKKDCFNLSILEADIFQKNIEFSYFFKADTCIKRDIDDLFSLHHAGGKLINFDNNNIVFSIGEFRSRGLAQDPYSINGKILKINKNSKKIKILSMGHRNVQGLFFDKESNFIYASEHGPQGGDEINIIKDLTKIVNFGWPISSYGEHYGYPTKDNSKIYKLAPLKKSHKAHGFTEPTIYYNPSIGISELIILKILNEKILITSALGYDTSEGDMSLHLFKLNNNKLSKYKVIPLEERVRDLIYLAEKKIIVLFLESSVSIGIIKLKL